MSGKENNGSSMKCTKCEYFSILYKPYRSGGVLWDMGRAECEKHKLVVDFSVPRQLERLECVEISPDDSEFFKL